jgi:1-deoxy-D-xylulose-5-phosphate synthase
MAKRGARPCFGVVSSFIQRAYDQLSQDVAINGTPVVLNIFYGSILGMNDVTHLGWFDIALISNIPGWVFLAPTCKEEYIDMLDWAMRQQEHPVAVRVPGGDVISRSTYERTDYSQLNRYELVNKGENVAIIAAGTFFELGKKLVEELCKENINATLINPRFLSGVDHELLQQLKNDHKLVITLEDGVLDGGFGEKIARFYGDSSMNVKCYGIEKKFLDRYNHMELLKQCRLDVNLLKEDILKHLL